MFNDLTVKQTAYTDVESVTCKVFCHVHHDGHSLIVHVSIVKRNSQVVFFHVPVLRDVKHEVGHSVNLKNPSCQTVVIISLLLLAYHRLNTSMCSWKASSPP